MNRPIMEINKPYYVVRLDEDVLEVDLKDGVKKELEDAVEKHPILKESLGLLLQTVVPLDVSLYEIKSVKVDRKGLKIIIPLRRDITIPLETNESQRLADKLNELIPVAKLEHAKSIKEFEEAEKRERPKIGGPL